MNTQPLSKRRPNKAPWRLILNVMFLSYMSQAVAVAQSPPVEQLPAPQRSLEQSLAALHNGQHEYMGALSCTATACHGSQVPNTRRAHSRGDEFVLWSDRDPHAKAAEVLASPRSQAIMQRLGVTATEGGHTSCVACHRPVNTQQQSPLTEALKIDSSTLEGVSCEACHGPAEKWLATHFRSASKVDEGRIATEQLLVRARLCADCHVGSSQREVNHDLIAAGHPALRFEFASYYQNLPKHWHDGERQHPQYYQRLWAAGQIASAEAALSLLEARAERAAKKEPQSVWPEFAEYACFDCHRSLRAPDESLVATTGIPRWNRSHVAGLKHVAEAAGQPPANDLVGTLIELDQTMSAKLASDPGRTLQLAEQSRGQLNAWLHRTSHEEALRTAADAPRGLIRSLASEPPNIRRQPRGFGFDLSQWDSAVNVYSAVAVLEQAHRARSGMDRTNIPPETAAVLQSRQNLADWYLLLKSEADPASVRTANEQFLEELLGASRHLQQRGEW